MVHHPTCSAGPVAQDQRFAPNWCQLREEGWCLIEDALPGPLLAALEADLQPRFEQTLFSTGGFYGERTKRFGRLLARSKHAAALVEHPLILGLAEAALKPWCDTIQLNLTQAIEIHPDALSQLPHRDQDMWQGVKGEVEYLLNVMWPLVPFTHDNGATRMYPRSHGAAALDDADPGESLAVECDPGAAIVFLGSTLHGAGGNETDVPRRGIIVSYCLGWLKPYENQWLAYPPAIARTFSPSLARLVGYQQHRPNLGNVDGLCPSLLLGDTLPARIGAVDALRPDQTELVAAFVADQAAGTKPNEAGP
ncbi:phytanoyl-CoA dioxygenase family protein [Sphingomonas sp. CL5.1]|uniref:phytanoyl-CoA dioxygenase family protein n=1 Tax=Sphingomonas sp. CL5.1 TaxID=2653203 RepID=UPI001581418F|nr:phytanoyl-CoA dioxygenase family protein [Sphingomonas sp. CL5.1]QKR98304.1 phytanoyl-CoA dioxygenase family protein [Sphingomonas sp. CL5.1]